VVHNTKRRSTSVCRAIEETVMHLREAALRTGVATGEKKGVCMNEK